MALAYDACLAYDAACLWLCRVQSREFSHKKENAFVLRMSPLSPCRCQPMSSDTMCA
eukprot:m.3734 g.3734  ORF g.3734 m.3734 type:complete len:57 (+) comp3716_c0_seq1:72-242(+)